MSTITVIVSMLNKNLIQQTVAVSGTKTLHFHWEPLFPQIKLFKLLPGSPISLNVTISRGKKNWKNPVSLNITESDDYVWHCLPIKVEMSSFPSLFTTLPLQFIGKH